MANGIYKVTMHARYLGQQLVNTLWYRSVLEGTFASDLLIDGAQALGKSVIDHIWSGCLQPYFPTNYYFDGVSVMGFNDMYEVLYNNTIFVAPTGDNTHGTEAASENKIPLANCVNLAFTLKNRLITLPWFKPPSKGLIALSPVSDGWVGNDGTLNDIGMGVYEIMAHAFEMKLPWDFADVELPFVGWVIGAGIGDVFIPVRAKTWQFDTPQIFGGITYMKHIETTDVEACNPRKLLGYRRSRRVEG
jgi:hypothetical protein